LHFAQKPASAGHVNHFRILLKIKIFISQKFLDTPLGGS
jgi:hypothetical protein